MFPIRHIFLKFYKWRISFVVFLFFAMLSSTIMAADNKAAEKNKPDFRFGVIADIQYADAPPHGTRYYKNSLGKLEDCVETLNLEKVDFTLNLGDLVDKTLLDLPPVIERQKKLKAPVYNTTGNHDYNGVKKNSDLYAMLDMPSEYYSFTKGNWKFILLNTNEVSSYALIKGTEKEKELQSLLARIKSDKRKNGASYNGGISAAQMKWLEKELSSATAAKLNVIVCTHHPLYPASGFTALNDKEILELLASFPVVKAVLSGHHHSGAFGVYKHIPCITLEGMIETEKENAYGIIELYSDRLVLSGKGRVTPRDLPFPPVSASEK